MAKYNPNSLETRHQLLIESVEQVIQVLKGLAALADQYSESCSEEMLCLNYGLNTQVEILEETLKDDAERKQEAANGNS